MRLTIRAFGLDLLDVDLSTDSPSPEPDDYSRDLSGGYTTATPVGFTAYYEQPDELGLPDRYSDE